jgi:hypothetical protein
MRPTVVAFALSAHLALNGNAASAQSAARDMTLQLPHPLAADETAFIIVEIGTIGRGQEVEVTTAAGQSLGVISPFSVRAGQEAGTYPLPVPATAVRDGRVSLRLTISQFGAPPRAPTAEEVRSVKLSVGPPSR